MFNALRSLLPLVLAFAGCASSDPAAAPEPRAEGVPGLHIATITRSEPRPLRIHHARIDLEEPRIELAVVAGADPDGDGPAESSLRPPIELAHHAGAVLLVNANAFATLDGGPFRSGKPAEVVGVAVVDGRTVSPAESGYASFWMTEAGRVQLGRVDTVAGARIAAAGFGLLLVEGESVRKPGGPRHPRTALGVDATGRWLHLVVVDGRQLGVSEGVTVRELAAIMAELGCHDAINLDGGGSSVMLASDGDGGYRRVNRPSGGYPLRVDVRPVPVGIAVRERE
ncbi:MAG: phosphodiester glycosidase family protein [Phycisphaeraceae bacterium]